MKSLQVVLTVNALSSGATGLLLIALANFVAQLFGVSMPGIFTGIGIFLLLFAGFVLYQSRCSPMHLDRIRFIILLDCLWVLASLVVVLWPTVELAVVGHIATLVVALWVGLMAYLQAATLKKVTV